MFRIQGAEHARPGDYFVTLFLAKMQWGSPLCGVAFAAATDEIMVHFDIVDVSG